MINNYMIEKGKIAVYCMQLESNKALYICSNDKGEIYSKILLCYAGDDLIWWSL